MAFDDKGITIKSRNKYASNWKKSLKVLKVIPYSEVRRIEIGILRSIRQPGTLGRNFWYELFLEMKMADGDFYKIKLYDLALLLKLIAKFKKLPIQLLDPLKLKQICANYEGEEMITYIKEHYDKLILGTRYPTT